MQESQPELVIGHFEDLGSTPNRPIEWTHITVNDVPGAATSATATTVQQHRVSGDTPNSVTSEVRSTEPHENYLSNEVAFSCLGAAGREPQYFGPSFAVYFLGVISSILRLPRRGKAGSQYSNTSYLGARRVTACYQGFPNAAMSAKLSGVYFTNIHPQYPSFQFRIWCTSTAKAIESEVPTQA